jgi:hypothetical protein
MLAELAGQLARMSVVLRLAAVRAPALAVLERSGLPARVLDHPRVEARRTIRQLAS